MFSYEFKPRLWPTLGTIPILIALLLLGQWQVERLNWKLGLIEQIELRATKEAVSLPADYSNLTILEYVNVSVTGVFNNFQEMTHYSVGPNGEAGYDLYTPFVTDKGRIIIVNRGWVMENMKNKDIRPDTIIEGVVTIEGLLRKPSEKLWYGPNNEPENNIWFYGDIEGMAKAQEISEVYPMFLYASKVDGDNGFPVAGRTELNIINNHLDYALTWFGLAIVLVGIYFIAHIKKKPF